MAIFAMATVANIVSPATAMAKSRPTKVAPAEINPNAPDPDGLLIDVYKSLAANNLQKAQSKIDALVEAYPHFQLAHLIQGDLLLMHTRPVASFGAGAAAQPDKLKDLRDEAAARIRSYRERPDPNLVPRVILQLRDDQKQAIVVDAQKSRLYVYENNAGQPKLTGDFYISQGKFGINKLKEGDQKTPIGVYYITSRLAGSKLPSFYGPGALPLNYPNEWDKINGRNGSGIWLHGMPPESFSRPPMASDGCVVLTNPDFLKIAAMVDIGKTPVIISEHVEFVNRTKWLADRNFAIKLLEDWRQDMESVNANRILGNYSRNFKTMQGDNLNTWFPKQQQSWDNWHNPSIRLKDVTHFRYPGKDELIVSTFTQETSNGKSRSAIRKRQYWLKEAARWRIVYETTV
ncbi:L,D-transpeptidase family protein [Undibacterium hunanense]|uniref:L,D-transpeptidase family protein n=1 Tax=Undibacterium hunanense TaxID=2762292 RepID=UPI001E33B195|nr:L,D-transpeptidase family protein [Undibacterium hunanense]